MKNKETQLNKTYIIIAVIIGVAILGYGILNFVSKEKDRQLEQLKLQQGQTNEQLKIQANQEALKSCFQKAEDRFARLRDINSVSAPKPSYPDARKMNNNEVADSIDKTLEDDKALCAKLYGKQQ